MANPANIAGIIAALKALYPNYNPDAKKTTEMFMVILGDLEPDALQAAVVSLASSGREFAPSAGQIRQEVILLNARAAGIPEAWQAYEEVVNMPFSMIKRRLVEPEPGTNGWAVIEETPLKFSHPLVEQVARTIGWPNTFPTDAPGVDRAQFVRAYEAEIERTLQSGNRVRLVQDYVENKRLASAGTIPALAQVTKRLEASHA